MFKLMQAKSLWNSMKLAHNMAQAKVREHQLSDGGGKAMSDEEVWNVDSPVTHNHYHTAAPQQAQPQKQSSGWFWKALIGCGLLVTGWQLPKAAEQAAAVVAEAINAIKPANVVVEQPAATTAESPESDFELGLGRPAE